MFFSSYRNRPCSGTRFLCLQTQSYRTLHNETINGGAVCALLNVLSAPALISNPLSYFRIPETPGPGFYKRTNPDMIRRDGPAISSPFKVPQAKSPSNKDLPVPGPGYYEVKDVVRNAPKFTMPRKLASSTSAYTLGNASPGPAAYRVAKYDPRVTEYNHRVIFPIAIVPRPVRSENPHSISYHEYFLQKATGTGIVAWRPATSPKAHQHSTANYVTPGIRTRTFYASRQVFCLPVRLPVSIGTGFGSFLCAHTFFLVWCTTCAHVHPALDGGLFRCKKYVWYTYLRRMPQVPANTVQPSPMLIHHPGSPASGLQHIHSG